MSEGIIEKFKSIDPAILSEVARHDLETTTFELIDWSVAPLSHEKVIETTGGLYRFTGLGRDGKVVKPGSAVLKIFIPEDGCQKIQDWCYWKRELLAYQSGLLARLPRGVRAPRCYGVSEYVNEDWIWLENIHETSQDPWTPAQFQSIARQLGQFAGAYMVGTPLPDQPWLCGSFLRSVFSDDEWWARFINPETPDNAWKRPVVKKAILEPLRSRILQIWDEKWRFIERNERLPQVFCHNDVHRQNLMMRSSTDGQEELIGIDWSFCGLGSIGNDLSKLVGSSVAEFAVKPAKIRELEAIVFESYLTGLHETGWSGDERLVWLGYIISLALWFGAMLPCSAAITLREGLESKVEAKYGRPVEAILAGWAALAEYSLDRADEALTFISNE